MKLRSLELVNHDHSVSYACKSVASSILFRESLNAHEINIRMDDEYFSFFSRVF